MKKIKEKIKNSRERIQKRVKELWLKNQKHRKLLIFAMVLFGTVGSFGLYALAQSVLDTFLDATKISKNWNVDMTGGEIKLKTRTCDNADPTGYFCGLTTTCANTLGDGQYIVVRRANEAPDVTWKGVNTACDKPQCGINGGQDGDSFVADNTLDFSAYPARNACKAIGARLPTKAELQCIYDNRALFGNNLGSQDLWSGTEYDTGNAWNLHSSGVMTNSNISQYNSYKYIANKKVRCVIGW